jgi:hypothetical protein
MFIPLYTRIGRQVNLFGLGRASRRPATLSPGAALAILATDDFLAACFFALVFGHIDALAFDAAKHRGLTFGLLLLRNNRKNSKDDGQCHHNPQ